MGDAARATCHPLVPSWGRAHCRLVPRQRAALRLLCGVRTCARLRLRASNLSRSVSPENKNLKNDFS